jgi:hypothetical protein
VSKIVVKPVVGLRPKPRVSGFVEVPPGTPGIGEPQDRPGFIQPPNPNPNLQNQQYPPSFSTLAQSPASTVNPPQQRPKQDQEVATAFVNDGRYLLLSDLPSRYLFYDFSELWIRPFTPNEARLLHMAKVSGNLTYIVSAVAACISKKISSIIIEDFEFCLYWLRLNSYPTKPFTVTWTCNQKITEVLSDEDEMDFTEETEPPADPKEPVEEKFCPAKNSTMVTSSNLVTIPLESDFVLPKGLALPTMAVFEEIWELRDRLENLEEDEEDFEQQREDLMGDIYLMNIAQWIAQGRNLQEKLEILKNSPNLEFQSELEISIAKVPNFGVSEDLDVQCVVCGGTSRRRLSLDYLTFFP